MKQVWRFVYSGHCSPAENMAIDEAIVNAHSQGLVPPTLRFYRWTPPALSIGYFQKAEDEILIDEAERAGIGFVRRMTGGRAVLHDEELTYSMIVSEDYPGIPMTVTEAYRVLSEGLLMGFRGLGLQAEMVNLSREHDQGKVTAATSAACFDAPSWYELVVEGRKVAGSAQTRQKGVILQHGSILLELDSDLLFRLLRFPNERVRERLKESFRTKAVAINDLRRGLGHPPIPMSQVEASFRQGIIDAMQIELVEGPLTAEEKALAEQLVVEKYGNKEWNLRR